jgi:hypothetical protein
MRAQVQVKLRVGKTLRHSERGVNGDRCLADSSHAFDNPGAETAIRPGIFGQELYLF